jgi:hypothetical protein
MSISIDFTIGGVESRVWAHLTPSGYDRVSFRRDIASKPVNESGGRYVIHPDVLSLVGRRISLRGYACNVIREKGIHEFLLTMDGGRGGFGAPVRESESVIVQLPAAVTWDFDSEYLAVSGEFEIVEPLNGNRTGGDVIYRLKDAIVRRATSPFGEWEPRNADC